jgi:L-2-hydroxyglutarate oxidase
MLDVVVVGAGIVGLSTAAALMRARRGLRLAVLDKETRLAAHQSGRNSGVIHSGIYYQPGSLKARGAREGRRALLELCDEHAIPHAICGKVIVATRRDELARLEALLEGGRSNGVRVEPLGPDGLRALEPHVTGIAALHVPEAGIIDFPRVCEVLAQELRAGGAEIRLGAAVTGLREDGDGVTLRMAVKHGREEGDGVTVRTDRDELRARWVVNCAGLQSDRVAAMAGQGPSGVRIIPFRGEYYELIPERRRLCNNLVYPVPDPRFPFLGVHFTRMIGGGVHAGPNAVLALAREGYRRTAVRPRDVWGVLSYPGFWRLAARHWRTGSGEVYRSLSKRAFVRALQRLVPEVRAGDLVPSAAGVRAQAIAVDGSLLDDFALVESGRVLSVVNAPSPAATASQYIGAHIAARLSERLAAAA